MRLGAVSGVGHGRLIFERFGKIWGRFAVERSLRPQLPHDRDGVHRHIAWCRSTSESPSVGRCTARRTAARRHHRDRAFRDVGAADVRHSLRKSAVHPADVSQPPDARSGAAALRRPGRARWRSSRTACSSSSRSSEPPVTPWQLFFQQSNVVDKRITPRWIPYERADTVVGALIVVIGATAIMIATAFAFSQSGTGSGNVNAFTNAYTSPRRCRRMSVPRSARSFRSC